MTWIPIDPLWPGTCQACAWGLYCPIHNPWIQTTPVIPLAPIQPESVDVVSVLGKLSDDDIERIAKRVAEYLKPGEKNESKESSSCPCGLCDL